MLNPNEFQGTRLRTAPTPEAPFNEHFVVNGTALEILEIPEDFISGSFHSFIRVSDPADLIMFPSGWVRASNITRTWQLDSLLSPSSVSSELTFAVRSIRDLEIDCTPGAAGEAQRIDIRGPSEFAVALRKCSKTSGNPLVTKASPIQKLTVSRKEADSMGIAAEAAFYCFLYPMKLNAEDTQMLIREAVSLSEGGATPAWLDLMLVGGFLYFDKSRSTLVCANAISPGFAKGATGASQPAMGQIQLVGPRVAKIEVADALAKAMRMESISIPSLQAVGFETFGWLNPNEKPDGHEVAHNRHGAFVYSKRGDKQCYYYTFWQVGDETFSTADMDDSSKSLHTNLKGAIFDLRSTAEDAKQQKVKQEAKKWIRTLDSIAELSAKSVQGTRLVAILKKLGLGGLWFRALIHPFFCTLLTIEL